MRPLVFTGKVVGLVILAYIGGALIGLAITWMWAGFRAPAVYARPGGAILALVQGAAGAGVLDSLAAWWHAASEARVVTWIILTASALAFSVETAIALGAFPGARANIWQCVAMAAYTTPWALQAWQSLQKP